MKDYTLWQRVLMVIKVIISIVTWVSRILFKIVRGRLPGAEKLQPVASTTDRAGSGKPPTS